MAETLQVLPGPEARGFSASCVSRPAEQWNAEMERWREADLSDRRWAHIRAGVCCGLRAEDAKLCALVLIGVDEHGAERFLAVADGVLGFWAALDQAYPHTRHRRCWLHKAGNILNVLPKSVQPRAKQALQQIWMA